MTGIHAEPAVYDDDIVGEVREQLSAADGLLVWVDPLHQGKARTVLGALGTVMALSAFALSQISPEWPLSAVIALCAVFGATAIGWNGVFVAEVARIAPGGNIALATGAALAFTYLGVVVAPFGFWVTVALSGSYTPGFVLIGVATLIAAFSYFRTVPAYP